MTLPPLGSTKDALDTPSLCIDLDRLDRNIATVADVCRRAGIRWRPHSKGHKSPAIARRQLEAGAIGITCAKLGEAEVMAEGGIQDLLIANLVVGPQKMQRLVALRKIADPIVCVDHESHVQQIGDAMSAAGLTCRALVEIDLGLSRVGVPPGKQALSLARLMRRTPGIDFAGIMGYEGHLLTIDEPGEKESKIRQALKHLAGTRSMLEEEGVECSIVSCGGTGSLWQGAGAPGITEFQAGGAIFMDQFYRTKCHVTQLEFALTVLVTVVSHPVPHRGVMDAGRKTLNVELAPPVVVGRDDLMVTLLSAEHGQLEVQPQGKGIQIGDRLEVIPGYADLTTVLHDQFYCFRGERLESIWPIVGRGRLQ